MQRFAVELLHLHARWGTAFQRFVVEVNWILEQFLRRLGKGDIQRFVVKVFACARLLGNGDFSDSWLRFFACSSLLRNGEFQSLVAEGLHLHACL